jgi:alkyl hydroperoxide reductase subunit F
MYDVIVLGGGPAGMTAGVYAARKKLNAMLICKDLGGQAIWATRIENYMGYQFVAGAELMQKFEDQVKHFPIEIRTGESVKTVAKADGQFEILTEAGAKYQSRTVIVATGKRARTLNIPGEGKLRGRGVTYCATCDGPLFGGQKVAVVGGGNSGLEAAADMIKIAERVYLIARTPRLIGDELLVEHVKAAPNVEVFTGSEVTEIKGDPFVSSVLMKNIATGDIRSLDVSGVLVEIGLIPNSDPVKDLLALNEVGEIKVDCMDQTSVPGVFAAGDVTSVPEKQVIIASGEGAKALLQAHRYLSRMTSE